MSSKQIIVSIKIIGDSSLKDFFLKKLNPDDYLPEIREELENNDTINDTLLFIKKGNDESVVNYEDEKIFRLREIITIDDDQNTLYLKQLYWAFLNDQCRLDYGRTVSFDGIKVARKQAFKMNNCELNGINSYKKDRLEFESKEDWMKKTNLFVNVDDGININNFVKLGLSAGSSQSKNFNDEIRSTYQYTEIGKVSLKFNKINLELTEEFKHDVIDAIKSKDPEKFEKITEEYGQFISTEMILGGRVYFDDVQKSLGNFADNSKDVTVNAGIGSSNAQVGYNSSNSRIKSKFYSSNRMKLLGGRHHDENFEEKVWIESLKDYQNWDCIEFKNPISIFQLLPDELPNDFSPDDLPDDLRNIRNLREGSYKSIGKKILYTNIVDCDYTLNEPGQYRIFELKNIIPKNILEIIQNEESDYDIFAAVVDSNEGSKKVFFNCQIFREANKKQSILIHGIQKKFHKCRYKLKIKIMVIGYYTNFNFILPDTISVEVIKNGYDSQDLEFHSIPLRQELDSIMARGIPFFGVPVLSNLDSSNNSLIIGHNFRNTQSDGKFNVDIFSYCVKKKCYGKLPKFTFCTLFISNHPNSNAYASLTFNFKMLKKPFIDLNERFTSSSIDPKFVSLYLPQNDEYKPIFLNQKIKQINIKYVNCNCNKACSVCRRKTLKISKNENIQCIVFSDSIGSDNIDDINNSIMTGSS